MKKCRFCHKERKEYMFYFLRGRTICWKCRPYLLRGKVFDPLDKMWRILPREEAEQARKDYNRRYKLIHREEIIRKRAQRYARQKRAKNLWKTT